MLQEKTCINCKILKPLIRFRKYRNKCLDCESDDKKLYRIKNKNILKTKKSEYYFQNKDKIIAEMASENMERVRNGAWSVANLISLTQDADLKHVLDDINTLSFELAMSKLQTITNPLLTAEIKLAWITKLQNNLYNG